MLLFLRDMVKENLKEKDKYQPPKIKKKKFKISSRLRYWADLSDEVFLAVESCRCV